VVFSNRERYVAIAVGLAVLVFALDRYLLTPYLTRSDAANIQLQQVIKEQEDARRIYQRQSRLGGVWTDMRRTGGLVADASEAEAQLADALEEWFQESGMRSESRKPDRPIAEGEFYRIGFQVSGFGSTAQVGKFLHLLETAKVPVRINDIQLRSRRENTDDLSLRINLSTLCVMPSSENPNRTAAPAAAAARGGQS
jgi:hypothetical protein